jgi:hypothetical protein
MWSTYLDLIGRPCHIIAERESGVLHAATWRLVDNEVGSARSGAENIQVAEARKEQ